MQSRLFPVVAFLAIACGIAVSNVSVVRAQGVTGAALRGAITTEDGESADGAFLTLTNSATGAQLTAIAENGGYFFDNVPPGDAYVLTVEGPGYKPLTRSGIVLRLGQRVTIDVTLRLEGEVIVIEDDFNNTLTDRGRTGSAARVTSERIEGLPLQGRNFTDLAATTPLVQSNSIGGQNNRYNNIQIDGGANNDLFGLSSSGTPGGTSGAKPLTIEAIDQFVVQVAPFDVRQSNFAGGQINAITKSGTNELHGSLFGYYQGKDVLDAPLAGFGDDPTFQSFDTLQLGGTVGGPIVRDKAHFFVAADVQRSAASFGNAFQIAGEDPASDIARAGFDQATAERFRQILATYGIDNPGNALAPKLDNPDRNLFAKVSTSVIKGSYLDLSYNLVDASQDTLTRSPTAPTVPNRLRDGYQLSNSGYEIANRTHTARAKLLSNWDGGRIANEMLAGYSRIRDGREVADDAPLILVKVGQLGSADSWLAAGAERFSQSNTLDQDIFQFQDNFTVALGKHRLTVGTSNELLQIRNVFLQAATGVWAFDSLDALEAGTPVAFQRRFGVSADQDPGTAEFEAFQTGWYVQDEWSVTRNLTIMPGFRVDVPFLSDAVRNPALYDDDTLRIDTSAVPSGNLLWSPRIGFNWDVDGDTRSVLRGGVGVFTGRPPYVWVSNAYIGNGLSQIELSCSGMTGVPVFTPDPDAQPTDCAGGTTPPVPGTNQGNIDYFDPDTKYPQNLRAALGADRRLTDGLTASADLLYTRDLNAFYINDENLVEQGVDAEGRNIYGTFAPTGFRASPTRVDTEDLNAAMQVFNKNGGRVYTATFQLQQRLGDRADLSLGYTYSNSRDRISFTSSQAFSNFQFAPVDGANDDRNVRPSAFDRPHKLTAAGTVRLPLGFATGLTYVGVSGAPYTWTVSGDVNADGISGNDAVFVPAEASQISLMDPSQYAALDQFISSQGCLNESRGHIIRRGACRNPWLNLVNLRLSWTSPKVSAVDKDHRLEIQFDIFNLLNLLNNDWGLLDQAASFETHGSQFLRAVGYDAAQRRPIYTFTAPQAVESTIYSPTASRWRMQLGARYTF
jgi:hypothetical protein